VSGRINSFFFIKNNNKKYRLFIYKTILLFMDESTKKMANEIIRLQLKNFIHEKKINISTVASEAGVARSSLSNWIHGKSKSQKITNAVEKWLKQKKEKTTTIFPITKYFSPQNDKTLALLDDAFQDLTLETLFDESDDISSWDPPSNLFNNNTEGYIYAVWNPTEQKTKIGRSRIPVIRLAAARTWIPAGELILIVQVRNAVQAESAIHRSLSSHRIESTEWFTIGKEEAAHVVYREVLKEK